MRISCISDVHGQFKKIRWPRTDVLVIAGDFCRNHSQLWASDVSMQGIWLEQVFVPMCEKLISLGIYTDIVIVPGNHDRVFQEQPGLCRSTLSKVDNVHLLIDEGMVIDGKRFWGSPWTPWFFGDHWAFNFPHRMIHPDLAEEKARETWGLIPKETDILITHGPPFTILDLCPDGKEAGCPYLASEVFKRIRPKVHIFGHIHDGYGNVEKDGIQFVNAAACTEMYDPINKIQVVTI